MNYSSLWNVQEECIIHLQNWTRLKFQFILILFVKSSQHKISIFFFNYGECALKNVSFILFFMLQMRMLLLRVKTFLYPSNSLCMTYIFISTSTFFIFLMGKKWGFFICKVLHSFAIENCSTKKHLMCMLLHTHNNNNIIFF
jgi:hypothetical protein